MAADTGLVKQFAVSGENRDMVKIHAASYRNVVSDMLRCQQGRPDRLVVAVLKAALNCRDEKNESIRLGLRPGHNRLHMWGFS